MSARFEKKIPETTLVCRIRKLTITRLLLAKVRLYFNFCQTADRLPSDCNPISLRPFNDLRP